MAELSWTAIKQIVHERANNCCEYCQTAIKNTGQAMHIEHIDPDGGNGLENLCLSCPNCNLSEAKVTRAVDPQSGAVMPLFNPRTQEWSAHFLWLDEGLRVEGLTPIGRATVQRLKMNRNRILQARLRWMESGHHPPDLSS